MLREGEGIMPLGQWSWEDPERWSGWGMTAPTILARTCQGVRLSHYNIWDTFYWSFKIWKKINSIFVFHTLKGLKLGKIFFDSLKYNPLWCFEPIFFILLNRVCVDTNDRSGLEVRRGFQLMNFYKHSYIKVFRIAEYESSVKFEN